MISEKSSSSAQQAYTGIVERVVYHTADTGYTIARFTTNERQRITIVGTFSSLQAGQSLEVRGAFQDHPRYGIQFYVQTSRQILPATLEGIEKYLGSGLIKGIGPITAQRIVRHFGISTFDIIEKQSERLYEVSGLAQKKVEEIVGALQTQRAIRDIMVFLRGHGISASLALKIYQQYGEEAISTVTNNPYRLAEDIRGIGFPTADTIAQNLGVPRDSPFRYRAGLVYELSQACERNGDCFLPHNVLIERTRRLLSLDETLPIDTTALSAGIVQEERAKKIIVAPGSGRLHGQTVCYLPHFAQTEEQLAKYLQTLLAQPVALPLERTGQWIANYTQKTNIVFSDQQQRAIEMAATQRVLVLTGGPGTGKTFTLKAIVALWRDLGKTLTLAAPTGRAAQRLEELTGEEAQTIHRLLVFDPTSGGFKHHADHPLPYDGIIIDESSMLDLFLALSLIQAIPPYAHLVLVGDVDQLPSVGPGRVLADLIASRRIPVVRLTQVFRQAQQSEIVTNAHRINRGQMPRLIRLSAPEKADCCWVRAESPQQGVALIRALVRRVLPQRGIDPTRDVQVLTPGRKGDVGTRNLNTVLQEELNPKGEGKPEMTVGDILLRVGDRVIHTVNNYQLEIFNGDVGTLIDLDIENERAIVRYTGRTVAYDTENISEIALAWAITVHKSQGSEYPVVLLPLFAQHFTLLTRNLVYTGITRARKLNVLIGSEKDLQMAVSRVENHKRYTALADRLQ